MQARRIKRNPPPPPTFNRADFYSGQIEQLLDDAQGILDEEGFEDILVDVELILKSWLDGMAYRKRLKKRLTI